MSNKHINVGNVPFKADFHIRIQNSSEVCCLLIFYTTMNTNSKIILMCGRKETLGHCWWECKLVQPLWKTVWRFLKKLKIELPYYPAIPLLGLCLEKTKMLIQKDTCSPMFMETLFTISKIWKQPKCPLTDEWIKKMWHIHTVEYPPWRMK